MFDPKKDGYGALPPGGALRIDQSTGEVTGAFSFAFIWLTIAIREARLAVEADSTMATAGEVGAKGKGAPIGVVFGIDGERTPGFSPAMVAITAASFALDAFYGAVKPTINPPPSDRARHRQIYEALKLGFKLGKDQHDWKDELELLFDTRDSTVHHAEKYEPLQLQAEDDTTQIFTPQEGLIFTPENARRAALFAGDVLAYCVENPKPVTAVFAQIHNWGYARLVEESGLRSASATK